MRPSIRHGPDGFMLHETICEYVQVAEMFGAELGSVLKIKLPTGMSTRQRVTAYGGGVLVFDQYGRVKYHIKRALTDAERQLRRLKYLWETGAMEAPPDPRNRFAMAHRERAQRGE